MKFLEIIIENSTEKLAKLYKPAYKASQNPENGITIQNKSAYHVIKDCAYIAHLYLPIYCFDGYSLPFIQLKGKFKKSEIEEFVQSTKTQKINAFLLNLILQKIEEKEEKQPVEKFSNDLEPIDPYGEYGLVSDTRQYVNQYSKISDDSFYLVNLLCEKFDVNK
jgi:hypothetical protein